MFPQFLPSSVAEIKDAEAIALLQRIQRHVVDVPFEEGMRAIATAYVHSTPASGATSNAAPILLLHGFDSSLLEFRRLFPWLEGKHETWVIDLFGSGFTEYIPPIAVNPRSIRQHLLGFIESWIRQPVILVGASLGGAVAIDFALHHAEWVRSLVLIDSVGFSGSFPVGQFLPNPLIELGADWLYFRKRAALNAASALSIFNPGLVDVLRCSLVHQEMPGWKAAIASFTQSGGYSSLGDRIADVSHSTLILWGTADNVLGITDATRFEQAISNSRLFWIEGAGHIPHFERPQLVANHLLAFVEQSELDRGQR